MAAIYTTPRTWTAAELVTASIMNAHVRDNFDYLKARPVARTADYDGTVFSTSSTSFVDITGASVSITTSGSSRLLILACVNLTGVGLSNGEVTALLDGVNLGDASAGMCRINMARHDILHNYVITHVTSAAVSDGAHTVKLQLKTAAGTLSVVQFSLNALEVF